MHHPRFFWMACLLCLALPAGPAAAYNQPSVNLGFTSFLDGGPPAGPGFYLSEYLQYYTSDDLDGIPGAEVDVQVSLTQAIYQSNTELLPGARWGLNVMLPQLFIDADPGFLTETDSGLGDLLVGPYVQWDPIMGEQGPLMLNRIELQAIFPTGKYDEKKALNPGSNHFSFNPYWAATVFLGPKVTASWRLHYLWNDKNEDRGADYLKPGQAWHGNFAAAVEVLPKTLRVGINGYFFDQLTHTKVDGVSIPDDERVFAVGPGLIWHINPDMHLFVNMYQESGAENRPEGERYNLRFVWHL